MTAAAFSAPATRRVLAAERLRTGSIVCLALLPLGMALANRSAPVFLTLSAALALAASLAEGQGAVLADRVRAALRAPLGLAVVLFLALAAVSCVWSPRPDLSVHALGEFGLSLGATLLLALALPPALPRGAPLIFATGLATACAVILADLATGLEARRLLDRRMGGFIHNRPALTILVLLPAIAVLLGSANRALAFALAGFATFTILLSDSAAAALGLACGLLAFLAARLVPRAALGLAAGGVAVTFVLAPFLGEATARLAPPSLHRQLESAHTAERVAIWRSFGAAALAQPLVGAGFGVSPRLHETPVADAIAPSLRPMLAAGHPHNAPLQVWAELGAVGAVLALGVLILVLRSLAALPPDQLPPGLALFAAAYAVSLVGHGAWQGWWPAAIGAAIIWLRAAGSVPTERA